MKKKSLLAGFTLLSVACLTIMVGCVIVPGLPNIAQQLGVGPFAGWLVTLPALGVVVFAPAASKFIEKVGLYKSLCIGLFFYGLLGCVGAFIHNIALLFADRLLLGGATAIVMTTGTSLISEMYSGSQRLKMIALQGMSIELGGVIFLFIGGVLAGIHWAWPFSLYLFAWLLLIMVLAFLPKPQAHQTTAVKTHALYKVSGNIKLTWFAALCSLIVFFTAIISLPLQLKSMGLSESSTGLFLAFISLVAVGAAWLMPKAIQLLSETHTLSVAFLFYALAHGIFSLAPTLYWMIPGAICMGFGFGLSVPLVNHLIVKWSEAPFRARNLAKLSMAIFLGQFLSSFLVYLPLSHQHLFAMTFIISIVISGLLFVGFHHTKEQKEHIRV